MIKKTTYFSIIIFFFMVIVFANISFAGVSVSTQTVNLNVGASTSISLTGTDATGTVQITSSDVNVASASGGNWIENNTLPISIVGKKEGTSIITISGVVSNSAGVDSDYKRTIKVNVTNKNSNTSNNTNNSNNSNNSNGNSNNNTSTQKSNIAELSNLGIKPNDFTGFRKSQTSYNVEVPYETEKVSVYATAVNNGKVTSGTGNKKLQVGKNTVNVVVTAEDGKTTKTYTLNITRKEQETEKNTVTESNIVENTVTENNIEENNLLEDKIGNSVDGISNDTSNQLLISTKDDSKLNKKFISDSIIGIVFAIIILLLIIYYTTQYNEDEYFEEQENNNINSVESEKENSKKEENKDINKNEKMNIDIEEPKKHQKGKRFK